MLLSAVSVLVVAQSSSEIPEGLMNNPVYRHPIGINILVDEHYVFRMNSSTVKATNKLLNAVFIAFSIKEIFYGTFCDLQMAIDCVSHKILLAKLEFYGVTGKFLNLIKSYPEDRHLNISVCSNTHSDNISSDLKKNNSRCSSKTNSCIFSVYIKDLHIKY